MAASTTTNEKLILGALDVLKNAHRMTLTFLGVFIISLFFRFPTTTDIYTAFVAALLMFFGTVGVWRALYKNSFIILSFVPFWCFRIAVRLNGTEPNAANTEWLLFLAQWMALVVFIPFSIFILLRTRIIQFCRFEERMQKKEPLPEDTNSTNPTHSHLCRPRMRETVTQKQNPTP